ncbi:MAG: GTPase, partial [Thermoplasmata archaeon]
NVALVRANIEEVNPRAEVIEAASPISVEDPDQIKGKRVLVVDDGPTLTHGNMPYGAAWLAAQQYGASAVVDPRPHAVGSIKEVFAAYPHLEHVLPAMGYSEQQLRELETTINASDSDLVLSGTPVDLGRLIQVKKPLVRVRYELQEMGTPTLDEILDRFLSD